MLTMTTILSTFRAIIFDGVIDVREIQAPADIQVNAVQVELAGCSPSDVRFTLAARAAAESEWVTGVERDGAFHFSVASVESVRVVLQQRRGSSLSCTVTLRGAAEAPSGDDPTLWRNAELGHEIRHLGRLHCKMPSDRADLCQRVLGGDWREMNALLPRSETFWTEPTVVSAYRRLFESPLATQFTTNSQHRTVYSHSFSFVLDEGQGLAPLCLLPQDEFYLNNDGQWSVNALIADATAAATASYVCGRRSD